MSINVLIEKIKKTGNPTVVGLDPKLDYIPSEIIGQSYAQHGKNMEGAASALLTFNKLLIDAICDIAPAVKPQSAYYEMYGTYGVKALYDTMEYAKSKGMYVIADVKRGDIGATSEAYATAYLGETELGENTRAIAFGADSMTVNPYLGSDGVLPFVEECKKSDKGIFVLVKTSNPSSGEIQDLISNEKPIYEHVAELVNTWGTDTLTGDYNNVGAVVGATYPEQAKALRQIMPQTYFLVPGYGAQGGTAKDVAYSFNKDGLGAIVNASRSIMCAYKKNNGDLQEAARKETIRMRDDICSAL